MLTIQINMGAMADIIWNIQSNSFNIRKDCWIARYKLHDAL